MNYPGRISEWEETPALFTAEEFMDVVQHTPFTSWAGKIELVDGVIVRMSPAHVPHWDAQHRVLDLLKTAFADQSGTLRVGLEPTVRLSSATIREPDVAVLRVAAVTGSWEQVCRTSRAARPLAASS